MVMGDGGGINGRNYCDLQRGSRVDSKGTQEV